MAEQVHAFLTHSMVSFTILSPCVFPSTIPHAEQRCNAAKTKSTNTDAMPKDKSRPKFAVSMAPATLAVITYASLDKYANVAIKAAQLAMVT